MEHLQNQMGFEAFRHAYRAAIKEVRTKIEILSEDFADRTVTGRKFRAARCQFVDKQHYTLL